MSTIVLDPGGFFTPNRRETASREYAAPACFRRLGNAGAAQKQPIRHHTGDNGTKCCCGSPVANEIATAAVPQEIGKTCVVGIC
jgi:hypothetical protein